MTPRDSLTAQIFKNVPLRSNEAVSPLSNTPLHGFPVREVGDRRHIRAGKEGNLMNSRLDQIITNSFSGQRGGASNDKSEKRPGRSQALSIKVC